jgi:choice-of-anchor C domain-containing protein
MKSTKMFKALLGGVILLLGFALTGQALAQVGGCTRVLVNGGFEQPVVSSDLFIPAGDLSLVGWTVVSGSVDVVPSTGSWPSFEGTQSLDLDGHSAGTIEQSFATTAGSTYVLSFAYANNPGGLRSANVSVLGAGALPLLSQDISHSSSTVANMEWTPFVGSFTADSATTTLRFSSTDAPSSFGGIALDAVCVQVEAPPVVFLLIDEDSIDNGNPPNFFSPVDVNDDIAEIGLRAQLPFFAANVGSVATLHTGQVGDEGWFALQEIPSTWDPTGAGDPTTGLANFVAAGPGFGSSEALLDKVPLVTPLRATGLKMLEGRQVCAVVYDSDISVNYGPLNGSLKGANLGIVAFEVLAVTQLTGLSSSSLPKVEIRILDAESVCGGPLTLFTEAPEPISSSEPFDVVP